MGTPPPSFCCVSDLAGQPFASPCSVRRAYHSTGHKYEARGSMWASLLCSYQAAYSWAVAGGFYQRSGHRFPGWHCFAVTSTRLSSLHSMPCCSGLPMSSWWFSHRKSRCTLWILGMQQRSRSSWASCIHLGCLFLPAVQSVTQASSSSKHHGWQS
jgi:hypothetical protein